MRRDARTLGRLFPALALLGWTLGCASIQDLIGGATDEELVAPAEALLTAGDLPGAASLYAQLASENPQSVAAATGHAYLQLLAGDFTGADATLAAVEPFAGEQVGEIRLRRALVALRTGDADKLDQVRELGQSSGLPEGRLLAAEVMLVDLASEDAIALLRELSTGGGAVGQTAGEYLELLQSGDQYKIGLAEAAALWALGDRGGACDAVEDSLVGLAEDDPDKGALTLLWAGRAVTSGRPAVARRVLEGASTPPDQVWRLRATQAMIDLAEGNVDGAVSTFETLREAAADPANGVPTDGLQDAIATACALSGNPEVAQRLIGETESPAAARCLLQAGAAGAARQHAPEGSLRTFLETQ